jgi:hypothetical protein
MTKGRKILSKPLRYHLLVDQPPTVCPECREGAVWPTEAKCIGSDKNHFVRIRTWTCDSCDWSASESMPLMRGHRDGE